MKFKLLLLGLALACSGLFAVNEAFAQQCKAQLMSGRGGIIIDIFTGSNPTEGLSLKTTLVPAVEGMEIRQATPAVGCVPSHNNSQFSLSVI